MLTQIGTLAMAAAVQLLLLILAPCLLSFASQLHDEWDLWKELHGKQYGSESEELHRLGVWLGNMDYINSHNMHYFIHT